MIMAMPRMLTLCIIAMTFLTVAESTSLAETNFKSTIEAIVDQMNKGSSAEFAAAIDADALLSRVFDGVDVGPALKSSFSTKVERSIPELAESMRKSMPEGQYARVLIVRRHGDTATALVRYGFGNDSFGYHDYTLQKDAEGSVRISDWLDYSYGNRYSETLRLNVVLHDPTAVAVKGLVPSYEGDDDGYAKLADLIKAYRDKDYQKYYNLTATLPRELQRSRFVTLLTCHVSRMTRDRNLFNEAYRALANGFGNDPTLAMMLLGYYYSKGDYQEVSGSLRSLQAAFGVRDAALLALMSRTALGTRNADEAAVLADEAISIEPNLEGPYWAAINAHVTLRHYSFAVATARSMEEQLGKSLSRAQFEDNALYADFVKSPQYREWFSKR